MSTLLTVNAVRRMLSKNVGDHSGEFLGLLVTRVKVFAGDSAVTLFDGFESTFAVILLNNVTAKPTDVIKFDEYSIEMAENPSNPQEKL